MKKALAIISLLLLTACSDKLTEGEVYEKRFRPQRVETMLLPFVVSNGETTTTTIMPYIITYPDRWVIYIREYDEKSNKFITEDYYVTEEVYSNVEIGSMFKFGEDMGTDDEPCKKERMIE